MGQKTYRVTLMIALAISCGTVVGASGDGNRLTYLDDPINPYYVGRDFPRLTTPMWVGEEGVEAVVVLAIDDMRGHDKWEQFLRPILERLKQIDGRAPVSIMTCMIDSNDPHLQKWLQEGLSLEVHTIDHPCPLLKDGDFAKARSTYDRCVDLLASVPNNHPVAFRMPCCDSLNTVSPRFFAEVFNKTTARANFLQLDTSVFNLITPKDPELPRELVFEPDGTDRFRKYIPADRTFVNTIEDYPYPYVIGRLCWEFPCVVPSDWSAQHLQKPNNPKTVEDWKTALDAVLLKQGVLNLVFHPHGWIKAEQIVELINYAVAKHGRKVKFLTFREALDRLNENLLGGHPLRDEQGFDNGVRLLDLNNDGYLDVVAANERVREKGFQTRIWSPTSRAWSVTGFPRPIVGQRASAEEVRPGVDAGVRFGILQQDGKVGFLSSNYKAASAWFFEGDRWIEDERFARGLSLDGAPIQTDGDVSTPDRGVRLRDLDKDGRCELIVSNSEWNGVLAWSPDELRWKKLPFTLPPSASLQRKDHENDSGVRFIDVDEDGFDDVVFSRDEDFGVYLFSSMETGWSRRVLAGKRGESSVLPPISDHGSNNGFWIHSKHFWWQNENTAKLKDLVDRRSFKELHTDVQSEAKTPESSLRSIQTRNGFEVELVAAEPLVMDPIAFAWGPDGKFWVVEMGDYPLGVDGKGKHGGRVRCLEDVDGDGRYDRSTVFLDELGFPTGVIPWRKGVLVTCAPDIFYAEDTDGDGRADLRRTFFTGFGQGNQQHRLNGLVWGLDGWLYGANGDSGGVIRSTLKPELEPVSISGRDFRIRPDDGLIEAVTGQTQFGRSCDDWGNWFGCNNSNPMYQFVLPDHYMRRNRHFAAPDPRVNVSVVPGASPVYPTSQTVERFNDPNTANRFTSACSAMVYRDDLFGPQFEGNSFVSEPVHNLVHREVMSPHGVTFTSRRAPDEQASEFLASSDNWFRPTTIKTGPDGSLWIADMYRLVIEHPEWIPKEWQERLDLRAGHDMGRIYRVFPVGKKPRPIPRLDTLDTAGLVAALDSPSGWQRDMAQMMLSWQNDRTAAPALERLVEMAQRPTARLQGLCTIADLGLMRDSVLLRALGDRHAGVRRHAVRLAEARLDKSPELAEAVLKLATDADASVRMQVAFSLGEWDDRRAGAALGDIARRDANDAYISAAVGSSASKHAAEILAVLCSPRDGADPVESTTPTALVEQLIGQVVAQGDGAALGRSLAAITRMPRGKIPQVWQLLTVAGVLDAVNRQGKSVAELGHSADGELRTALTQLAELQSLARGLAADPNAALQTRVAAVRLLGRDANRQADDLDALLRFVTPQTPGELQEAAVVAAARIRDSRVSERLLAGWASHGPRVRNAILDVLLTREPWWITLIDSIEDGRVPAAQIDAGYRQRMLDHKSSVVRERAARAFGRPSDESRQKIIDQYRSVADLAADSQRGAAVFQKSCAGCHRIGSVGHEIGPDLSSMANRTLEFFLTAILDPNRAVETRYLSYLAATRDGRVFTGILAAETGNSVTLLAQEGKRETLLRTDIESLQSSGKSLMPDGVDRDISPQDMADLIAFLHSAGPPRKSFAGNKPELVKPELLRHELYLLATTCEIYGSTLVFEDQYKNLGYWSSENDHAVWNFEVDRPGKYTVTLDYACDDGTAGNAYVLELDESQFTGTVPGTGNWDTYKQLRVGTLTLDVGRHRLIFRPAAAISGALIDLRGVRISPSR